MVTSDASLVVIAGVCDAVGAEVAGGVALAGVGCGCAVDATACEGGGAEGVLKTDAVADGTAAAVLAAVTAAFEGGATARVER